jgi:hypothetical protein
MEEIIAEEQNGHFWNEIESQPLKSEGWAKGVKSTLWEYLLARLTRFM